MLKIKWTDRITKDEVFQKVKEERLLLKILKNRRHSWKGHTIRHNEFVVNIREGAISGKKAVGRPRLRYLKQVARNTGTGSYTAMKRIRRLRGKKEIMALFELILTLCNLILKQRLSPKRWIAVSLSDTTSTSHNTYIRK